MTYEFAGSVYNTKEQMLSSAVRIWNGGALDPIDDPEAAASEFIDGYGMDIDMHGDGSWMTIHSVTRDDLVEAMTDLADHGQVQN